MSELSWQRLVGGDIFGLIKEAALPALSLALGRKSRNCSGLQSATEQFRLIQPEAENYLLKSSFQAPRPWVAA